MSRTVPPPRKFLGYGFVWTGSALQGYLVPLRDLPGARAAAPHVTRGAGAKLRALLQFLRAPTRARFADAVAAHVALLPAWRACVRAGQARDARTLCLLEVAPGAPGTRRPRFAGFPVAAAAPFDFRAARADAPLARSKSAEAPDGAPVSCAAMLVLLDLQDELVARDDRGAEQRLLAAVLALYDRRPGAQPFCKPLRSRMVQAR